ncbi:Pseudouridine synthase/archaeosine transglycosylase [Cinnamomum micranthum f. kanehirae]|uniref:Pseudouridine synthase/archaeosine transglycosylase n=1 Tax=Cinnamomum micranthum f. kanehirae TaxID=337451 RepID=A0A443PCL0_9MAGN|nr:Pseudouridine synthase/archaeosine transglycosylase [Cinnamomum micranthum f. kanehirae]
MKIDEATSKASKMVHTSEELKEWLEPPYLMKLDEGTSKAFMMDYTLEELKERLSGLIVDVFGNLAVIASSAAWVEKYKSEIQFYISRISEINHIKWRPSVDMLKEEGLDLSDPRD